MLTTAPRGTKDILPQEIENWRYVEAVMRRICAQYGYKEIRTPVFEHTELFKRGIGDTIRVSLTADPVKEIAAGKDILKALDLDSSGPQMISCPSCGRTKIDLIGIANEVEQRLRECNKPLKVAVMGCAVNGPGEAKEADIGIAGGDGVGLIFKKGEVIKKVPEDILIDTLMEEILKM